MAYAVALVMYRRRSGNGGEESYRHSVNGGNVAKKAAASGGEINAAK